MGGPVRQITGAVIAIKPGMKNHHYSFLEMPHPEPWPEPVDGQLLLDQIAGTMRQIAVLPPWAPEALALFTPHTYAFQLRDVSTG
jgi:hypothetical protein